jgi:hypothetical protein
MRRSPGGHCYRSQGVLLGGSIECSGRSVGKPFNRQSSYPQSNPALLASSRASQACAVFFEATKNESADEVHAFESGELNNETITAAGPLARMATVRGSRIQYATEQSMMPRS